MKSNEGKLLDRLSGRVGAISWALHELLLKLEWSGQSSELFCGNENIFAVCPICGERAKTPTRESGRHKEECEMRLLMKALSE